ncbi:hypothetical protein O181_047648 [Austropuccinia psidii MF-1]|uniref:Phosphoacetylglucosamine mutase n=1 Tax=Austropuccinia psidii MF-1 TaxID=1389203 RepID=A0A9Q3DUD3_9BASI|nr:hypothetical protein [Austropuccinia psidii MF-1]
MDFNLIKNNFLKYNNNDNNLITYGTAGFRNNSNCLDSVFFIVGLLAGLRSKKLDGKIIGIMVTASHNPEEDNGVKLIDPKGEMLISTWEKYASQLANSKTEEDLILNLNKVIKFENINLNQIGKIIFGYDTRPSCKKLINSLKDGLKTFQDNSMQVIDMGLKTTPQLHYLVKSLNDNGNYGKPTEEGYYEKLSTAFISLNAQTSTSYTLTIDCANGVGAPKLEELKPYLKNSPLELKLLSTDISTLGKLNKDCGADFVKTHQSPPRGITLEPFARACSFDGDADRVVYYYFNDKIFRLMDGDKIATLVASYIKELVELEPLSIKENLHIGVVQTAYANGNSTRYIEKELGLPITCTPTGVKHLHHAAQAYDIGIYFEANGHGTVLFSDDLIKKLSTTSKLYQLAALINQTVGDSISDMLLVETILNARRWSMLDWDQGYEELPNRLVKVLVTDRRVFVTEDAERKLVEPVGMQAKLDDIVKGYQSGRSFVRPSGTEDCVRVYAEAATRELTDELAFKVAGMVFNFSGKGDKPKEFL